MQVASYGKALKLFIKQVDRLTSSSAIGLETRITLETYNKNLEHNL